MTEPTPGAPPAAAGDAPRQVLCTACRGTGSIVMSLCCGRGCATCPGDGMLRAVDCDRCGGTGTRAGAAPGPCG